MTEEQYWERDPYLVRAYEKAHELYIERKNQELYMQGLYDYQAFKAVGETLLWNWGGRKGARPEGYREYPIPVTPREKEAEHRRSIAKTLAWVEKGQKGGGA